MENGWVKNYLRRGGILHFRSPKTGSLESQKQCRIENEFFTPPKRHLNDRNGGSFTLGWRGKSNFQQLFSDSIPSAYVAEWVLPMGNDVDDLSKAILFLQCYISWIGVNRIIPFSARPTPGQALCAPSSVLRGRGPHHRR